jgi:hypothetical protein
MEDSTGTKKKSWFARHKVWTGILAFLVVAAVLGAASPENSKTGESKGVTTKATKTATPAPKAVYGVNEPATISDQTLTVTGVQRNYSSGNQYVKPDAGQEYVVVSVTIQNNGNEQVSYNTYDFQMQDSNGVQKTEAFVTSVENQLQSGNLAAGGKVTGNLAYEVPKGDTGLKLIFKPSFWSSKTVTVQL